jgi:hypothetical protein
MSNNEKLIAYCGLYCGDCFGYKGKIAELAKDLRKELRQEKFEIMIKGIPFKALKNYKECYDVLGVLVRLRCTNTCKGGGGNPFCKIRKCCQKEGIVGCWKCNDFETCEKLDSLKENHGDAHIKNLRMIQKKGIDEFLKGKKYWYSKEKGVKK